MQVLPTAHFMLTWLHVHASAHHGACHAPRGSSCGTSASGAGLSVICERARAPCNITIPNHSIAAYRACCRADGRGSGCGRAVTVPRCLGGVWNRLPCKPWSGRTRAVTCTRCVCARPPGVGSRVWSVDESRTHSSLSESTVQPTCKSETASGLAQRAQLPVARLLQGPSPSGHDPGHDLSDSVHLDLD
jgi:hypothetical protein